MSDTDRVVLLSESVGDDGDNNGGAGLFAINVEPTPSVIFPATGPLVR